MQVANPAVGRLGELTALPSSSPAFLHSILWVNGLNHCQFPSSLQPLLIPGFFRCGHSVLNATPSLLYHLHHGSPCVPGLGGVPFWYPPQRPARTLSEQSMCCVNSLFSHLSSPTDCGLHRDRLVMALLHIPMYTECPACSRCLT